MFRRYNTSQLVEMIKAGSAETAKALEFIIARNEDRVLRHIMAKGGSREDAEDMFQEGLTDLVMNVRNSSFMMNSSIHTYLIGICKNKWSNKFRRNQTANTYATEQLKSNLKPGTMASATTFEAIDEITYWLEQLKEGCREVLLLWAQGYNMNEIAKMMGYKSRQVAMNKKSACMKALHENIAKRA